MANEDYSSEVDDKSTSQDVCDISNATAIAGDIRSGVIAYGSSGVLTGNLVLPGAGNVFSGIGYGASGTEFTGTLLVGVPLKTGQTVQYSTGDDGTTQKGYDGGYWVNGWDGSTRFTDNLDGTVTDNLTGIMWMKNPNCMAIKYNGFDADGAVIWQLALDFVDGINNGTYSDCQFGYTDWRIPTIRELLSLVDYSKTNPALPAGHPFDNVLNAVYYSATTWVSNTGRSISVDLGTCEVSNVNKDTNNYVWYCRK